MPVQTLTRGKVKWFNNQKGFGFLLPEGDEGRDVFIHYSAILGEGYKTLSPEQAVEFELVQGPKGDMARNVVRL
ncbi:MAG: cold-shock protein [Candidatus Omnitrophica bacterium]|nr:cold-shock protein [Candidatus Omnitrophota bacterium]